MSNFPVELDGEMEQDSPVEEGEDEAQLEYDDVAILTPAEWKAKGGELYKARIDYASSLAQLDYL